jgi:hypothetical protein
MSSLLKPPSSRDALPTVPLLKVNTREVVDPLLQISSPTTDTEMERKDACDRYNNDFFL